MSAAERVRTAVRWRLYLALSRLARADRRLASPSVALTFDDGPDPESTPAVLDVLASHGVPATFFCVGYRAREHPELVHRMVAEGHAVGSHSETHRVTGLPAREAMADYLAGRRSLEDVLGRPVPLFRPPHGRIDAGGARALRGSGLRTWLWTVDPADYAPGTTAESALRVLDGAAAGDVVLMHDGLEEAVEGAPPRSLLQEYLPEALSELKRRGTEFAPLA
ncbi:polysaccharide deacetylase family protein [Geodermatophilus sp. SYSU D00815]